MTNRSLTPARLRTLAAGTLLAAGAVLGLAGCDGGAQTYPDSTMPGSETVSPTPSETGTPVPTTVDESGTLGG